MKAKSTHMLPDEFVEVVESEVLSKPDKLLIGRGVVNTKGEEVNSLAKTVIVCFLLFMVAITLSVPSLPAILGCSSVVMLLSFSYFAYRGIQFQNAESELMFLEMAYFDELDLGRKKWVNTQDDYLVATADALACMECHLPGDCPMCGAQ